MAQQHGLIRQADEQGMGIILMRPLTSGIFQRLMAEAFPEIDVLDVGRLLLNYVLSDPYVDVALVGMCEPRSVELNNKISDDVGARIDLAALHERKIGFCALGAELQHQVESSRKRQAEMQFEYIDWANGSRPWSRTAR